VVGLFLALAPPAHALPPTCASPTLDTPPQTRLTFPGPPCTDPENDAIVLSIVTPPTHGTLASDGTYYDPDPLFPHGRDQFTYRATTPANGDQTTATVTILVDNRPQCANGTASVAMNGQVALADLPCSDTDGAADYFIWATDGQHGRIDFLDERTVTYTPDPNFSGTDTFTISAEDRFGLESADATMTITVVAPVAATPAPTPVPTPAPFVAPKDLAAPTVTLKGTAKPLKQALSKGISLDLSTNENASATITLTLDRASARKLGVDRKAKGPVTVGKLTAALTPGKSTLAVKLSVKARKALKAVKKVKLTLTAVVKDAAGNTTTKTLSLTLKR
jgi:hypothetical protein